MARKVLTILLLAAAPAVGGCNVFAFLGYLIAPVDETTRTVEADYKGPELAKHSLAVVVWASQKVRYEHPTAQEHVTKAVKARFEDPNDKDRIKNLRVIGARTVLDYQQQNIYWDEIDKTQLGKALGADFVLFVSLMEFTTREPMAANMLRGMVTAEVSLYKSDLPERQSRVYKSDDIRVAYPGLTFAPVQGYDDRELLESTVREFAQKVVWKFYKHKEPVER